MAKYFFYSDKIVIFNYQIKDKTRNYDNKKSNK